MLLRNTRHFIQSLLILLSFGFATEMVLTSDAEARAGGKRSIGKRSSSSNRNSAPQQQVNTPNSNRGSLMKGLAGGLAGGLLGGMLFSSLGQASGIGGAAGGGGIGFLEIILIGGLVYLAFRFWKSRQNRSGQMATAGGMPMDSSSWRSSSALPSQSNSSGYFAQGSSMSQNSGETIETETAEDIFFKIQGAWTRRDLTGVQNYMERDVALTLEDDIADLKRKKQMNRLENISVRRVDIEESWSEPGRDLVKVRFTASLLDYNVDEINGEIREGSDSVPVKFDENWIFSKSHGRSQWQVAGIEQI